MADYHKRFLVWSVGQRRWRYSQLRRLYSMGRLGELDLRYEKRDQAIRYGRNGCHALPRVLLLDMEGTILGPFAFKISP